MDIIRGATVTERAALEYRVDQNKWNKFLASSLLGYVMHFTKNVKNMYILGKIKEASVALYMIHPV